MLFTASELGDKKAFEENIDDEKSLSVFIRELVGLDRETAKNAFSDFLNDTTYNAKQIEFINFIIDHLAENGVMEMDALFQSPFVDLHYQSVFGLFDNTEVEYIQNIIEEINSNAQSA